jgi:hypothetical protein
MKSRASDVLSVLKSDRSNPRFETDCGNAIINFFKSGGGVSVQTLHQTYTLARIRLRKPSQIFSSVSEISYRPVNLGGSRQRASGCKTSLFYGSSCERRTFAKGAFTDELHGLRVAIFETLPALRKNHRYGYGRIDPDNFFPPFKVRVNESITNIRAVYGLWSATSDINLASVCPHRLHDEDHGSQFLRDRIIGNFILEAPFERFDLRDFWDAISAEFGYAGEECNYVVSSIIAEVLYELGFDGVYYPSARCDGLGINVALKPAVIDTKLRCVKVGAITISVIDGELIIKEETAAELPEGCTTFRL